MANRSAQSWFQLVIKGTIFNALVTGQDAVNEAIDYRLRAILPTGVEANQANRAVGAINRMITAGNHEDIDIYDFGNYDFGSGLGNDSLGQSIEMEEVVALVIKHRSGAGLLEVLGSVPPDVLTWAPVLTVANGGALKSGGVVAMYSPGEDAFNVTDASIHRLRLGAINDHLYYDFFVLGRNAD